MILHVNIYMPHHAVSMPHETHRRYIHQQVSPKCHRKYETKVKRVGVWNWENGNKIILYAQMIPSGGRDYHRFGVVFHSGKYGSS
jgi:hypothetical protein